MGNNKGNRRWLVFVTMPCQMGLTIFLFHLAGTWLDSKYEFADELANKICTLLGVALALYQVIKQVNKLNQD